ncbi:MAG: serine/threonine-protein kinase, partial [Planctomycetota bacterium]|nr:serine/threonine-protein kinase [Planctomycetota bacterium]
MDLNKAQGRWLIDRGRCQLDVVNWAFEQIKNQPGADLVDVLLSQGYISIEIGRRARSEAIGAPPPKSESSHQNQAADSNSSYVNSSSDFTATVGLDAAKSDSLQFDPVARKVGPYELGEELGRGGMGVVYKATHETLKRSVALKMLLAGPENSQALQRFEIEASAMARLRHPNIIKVFDVALGRELAYVAMEFVDGPTLKEKLEEGVTVTQALTIAEKMGRALHHAHCQNIIHRDMKPANVLLTKDDEPILTDFGLAKALDENTGLSQTGTLQGTPSYMSPEQVEGKSAR